MIGGTNIKQCYKYIRTNSALHIIIKLIVYTPPMMLISDSEIKKFRLTNFRCKKIVHKAPALALIWVDWLEESYTVCPAGNAQTPISFQLFYVMEFLCHF